MSPSPAHPAVQCLRSIHISLSLGPVLGPRGSLCSGYCTVLELGPSSRSRLAEGWWSLSCIDTGSTAVTGGSEGKWSFTLRRAHAASFLQLLRLDARGSDQDISASAAIWDWAIRGPVHCSMFSSILGLFPFPKSWQLAMSLDLARNHPLGNPLRRRSSTPCLRPHISAWPAPPPTSSAQCPLSSWTLPDPDLGANLPSLSILLLNFLFYQGI